jgi:hypothetical protein
MINILVFGIIGGAVLYSIINLLYLIIQDED